MRDDIPDCVEPYLIHKVSQNQAIGSDQITIKSSEHSCQGGDSQPHGSLELEASGGCTGPTVNDEERTSESVGEQLALRERFQSICRPVSAYLEKRPEDHFKQFFLAEKWFKRFWCMDIILEDAKSCCCFTKA